MPHPLTPPRQSPGARGPGSCFYLRPPFGSLVRLRTPEENRGDETGSASPNPNRGKSADLTTSSALAAGGLALPPLPAWPEGSATPKHLRRSTRSSAARRRVARRVLILSRPLGVQPGPRAHTGPTPPAAPSWPSRHFCLQPQGNPGPAPSTLGQSGGAGRGKGVESLAGRLRAQLLRASQLPTRQETGSERAAKNVGCRADYRAWGSSSSEKLRRRGTCWDVATPWCAGCVRLGLCSLPSAPVWEDLLIAGWAGKAPTSSHTPKAEICTRSVAAVIKPKNSGVLGCVLCIWIVQTKAM